MLHNFRRAYRNLRLFGHLVHTDRYRWQTAEIITLINWVTLKFPHPTAFPRSRHGTKHDFTLSVPVVVLKIHVLWCEVAELDGACRTVESAFFVCCWRVRWACMVRCGLSQMPMSLVKHWMGCRVIWACSGLSFRQVGSVVDGCERLC